MNFMCVFRQKDLVYFMMSFGSYRLWILCFPSSLDYVSTYSFHSCKKTGTGGCRRKQRKLEEIYIYGNEGNANVFHAPHVRDSYYQYPNRVISASLKILERVGIHNLLATWHWYSEGLTTCRFIVWWFIRSKCAGLRLQVFSLDLQAIAGTTINKGRHR